MAQSETYYIAIEKGEGIPAQYDWEADREDIETYASDRAEDDGDDMIGYRIEITPIFKTVRTVSIEKL